MAIVRRSREFWGRLVAEVDASPLKEVARRHRVEPATLKWWRWELRRSEPSRTGETKLLPVVLSGGAPLRASVDSGVVTIEVAGGIAMRVPIGADPGYVAALVAAVRSAC